MKKLTTNQLLMAGGVIALIYILYKKKKAKNGSEMIKDALNDIPDVSVSDGDKDTREQGSPIISSGGEIISSGGVKTKSCKQALAEFNKIKMTSRMTEEQLFKLRDKMLSGCTGAMPMPTKTLPPLNIKGGSRVQLAGITI